MTMNSALVRIFKDNEGKILKMGDIYKPLPKYYELSATQLEIHKKYRYPNFHHSTRSTVSELVKKGIVRGMKQTLMFTNHKKENRNYLLKNLSKGTFDISF